jgi:hypothetical protein
MAPGTGVMQALETLKIQSKDAGREYGPKQNLNDQPGH